MPRILIAECKQEVSSFNPVASHYEDFAVSFGADLIRFHRRVRNEIGGALSVLDAQRDIEVVPAYSARAITSAGPLAAVDFEQIASEFLDALKVTPPVDGVYFSLHGAMSVQGEDDPEGFLLSEARKILGERVPIVISLDLHGILTDRMLEHSDAMVVYHTYPHIDFFSTGQRAANLLLRIMSGQVHPVTAKVEVPALVRGDELITESGSIRHVIQAALALEQNAGGLSAGMFWGNPFTDVPDLRSNSVVVLDGDEARAAGEALRLASIFWEHHEKMQVPLSSVRDAANIAADNTSGTVVLVDAADATSSGATGDSNAILRGLVELGYARRALIPIVDAPAVREAFAAGVGNRIRVTVGGSLDPTRFQPLPIEARVHMLSEGRFYSETTRDRWNAGPTVVLSLDSPAGGDGITLVVTSRAVSLYDRALFYAHGQDPRYFDAVVVKSPHCEQHMFKAWAARYIDVDAPGATSANLRSLGHTRAARPTFPLDPDVPFHPQVKLFRRPQI